MHARSREKMTSWHHVFDLKLNDKYVFFKLQKHPTTLRLCTSDIVTHNEAPVYTKKRLKIRKG